MMDKHWHRTSLPAARSRTDDVWFLDENRSWAVNSDGKVFGTQDAAQTWQQLALFPTSYLRCIGFSSRDKGWLGTLSGPHALYQTGDGGADWTPVANLPDGAPGRVCGLSVVNERPVFAAGTNYPNEPAGVVYSNDGGASWSLSTFDHEPALLVDILFDDEETGWVVGAIDAVRHPERATQRGDVVPAVYATSDGGRTWRNALADTAASGVFPRGEWGWKIQKLGAQTLLVSLQNFHDGAMLRSDDLGVTWQRLAVNDKQRNANLEGIGFVDDQTGWVGGWGDYLFQSGSTSVTRDGGKNWTNANHVGFRLNRFRFIGNPVAVGYASGDTVYKYSDSPTPTLEMVAEPELVGDRGIDLDVDVPEQSKLLTVRIWERFGREVRQLVQEGNPTSGKRSIHWDFLDDNGKQLDPGSYIVRVVTDGSADSRVVHRIPEQQRKLRGDR